MTQSIIKAQSGFIKIAVGGREFWSDPKDIKVNDVALGEFLESHEKLEKKVDEIKTALENEIGMLAIKVTNAVAYFETLNDENVSAVEGLRDVFEKAIAEFLKVGV